MQTLSDLEKPFLPPSLAMLTLGPFISTITSLATTADQRMT